jgi:hypothetical protein
MNKVRCKPWVKEGFAGDGGLNVSFRCWIRRNVSGIGVRQER